MSKNTNEYFYTLWDNIMAENNMEPFVSYAINSYTNNLIVLYSAHKCNKDIADVLNSEPMNISFAQYLEREAQVFKTEALLVHNFLSEEFESMQLFQDAYNDLKHDIAGNYTNPSKEQLMEINDKIIAFAKSRKQPDRWSNLYKEKQHAA